MARFKIVVVLSLLFAVTQAFNVYSAASNPAADDIIVADDVRVSPAEDQDPRNETSVAVSAIDPLVIAGASKVILGGASGAGTTRVAYYFSGDGGRSWGTGLVPLATPQKTFSRASDPSVAANLDGDFYLCALMLDNSSFDNGVYVFKSTNNGRTFSDPVPAFLDLSNIANPRLSDKCYITVDRSPTSPFKNTVYAVWSLTDRDPSGFNRTVIQMARRRPGDAAFSAPKTISHEGDMRGPSISTGPAGEIYVAWEGIGNPKVLLFNGSTDGGDTFFPANVAPSIDVNIHNFTGSLSEPGAAIFINGVPRMNSFPVIDVDRSAGPNRGTIYVAWAESTNRFDADVFVKRIPPPNGGRPEVSPSVKVNNDGPGADQFFPWLSVDANNGSVCVAFYDRRDDGTQLNMYLARSTDGGNSFAENTRASIAGTDPRIQASVVGSTGTSIGIGDYIGLTATRGKAHLLWADTRNRKQEIFYSQLEYSSSGGGGPTGPPNDTCESPRVIGGLPFQEEADTRSATGLLTDPVSCSGNRDSHSVWYSVTAAADTMYGVDTHLSDYDTVVSVYTGSCSSLTRIACSDDFGGQIAFPSRSMLAFPARAGVTYLIQVSGKGSGGTLNLRAGAPTALDVSFKTAPDGSKALRITGAGFVDGSARVTIQRGDTETELPTLFFLDRQADGTAATMFATKKKLKKLVKAGTTVLVRIESPAGSNRFAAPFFFTR